MSRRNMHILPKKTRFIVSREKGRGRKRGRERDNRNGSGGYKNKLYTYIRIETSILWGGSRKYCVVNTLFFCLVAFCATIIKTYLSHHIISYHSMWHTQNCSFIVVKTTKQFVHTPCIYISPMDIMLNQLPCFGIDFVFAFSRRKSQCVCVAFICLFLSLFLCVCLVVLLKGCKLKSQMCDVHKFVTSDVHTFAFNGKPLRNAMNTQTHLQKKKLA